VGALVRGSRCDDAPVARIYQNEGNGMSETASSEQLRLFIERIETLEEEKKGTTDDIKDVYGEAKATGFDTKTMKAIVRLRKMEANARQEADALLETYRVALGLAD
jgi:uncharacterized protein (UPF0335 family)